MHHFHICRPPGARNLGYRPSIDCRIAGLTGGSRASLDSGLDNSHMATQQQQGMQLTADEVYELQLVALALHQIQDAFAPAGGLRMSDDYLQLLLCGAINSLSAVNISAPRVITLPQLPGPNGPTLRELGIDDDDDEDAEIGVAMTNDDQEEETPTRRWLHKIIR